MIFKGVGVEFPHSPIGKVSTSGGPRAFNFHATATGLVFTISPILKESFAL